MKHIKADNANELWLKTAKIFENPKNIQYAESRIGDTAEMLHVGFTLNNPTQRWVSIRKPSLNPAFALAEVVWILNGSNDAEFINFWNPRLPKYSGNSSKYHGAYGYRLRTHLGFDQLERAYLALSKSESSRQVVLQIWDSSIDLPNEDGTPKSKDIPCNVCSMLKVRNNKLEWMQIMRSNDFFLGLPFNLVQFTTLQEIVAGWLNLELGTYNHLSDSLHIYKTETDKIGYLEADDVSNSDSLFLPKKESEEQFKRLYLKMHKMIKSNISKKEFESLFSGKVKNRAMYNILLVIGADAARRKKWHQLSNNLMSDCTNLLFMNLWNNWVSRQGVTS